MVIGYARVSTIEQSLSMQIAALKRAGVTDAGLYVEKVSAVSTRRPKLMQMLGVIAEFERNLTIERTTAGMARAREEGKQVGQPPALTPKQVEQAQKMRDKRKSVREIAAHFDVSHGTIYNWTNGPKRSRRKS